MKERQKSCRGMQRHEELAISWLRERGATVEESLRKGVWAKEMMTEEEGVEYVDATIQTDDADPTSEEVTEEPEFSTPEDEEPYRDMTELFQDQETPPD